MTQLLNKHEKPDFMKGMWPDVAGENDPLVLYAENAVFDASGVRPCEGQVQLVLPQNGSQPLLGLNSQQIAGDDWIIWGDKHFLWGMSIAARDIDGLGTLSPDLDPARHFLSFVSWGDWTLVASEALTDILLREGPGEGFVALSDVDAPSNAKILAKASRYPFVIAFFGSEYAWCDLDNVEEWTVNADTQAGGNVFRDADSATSWAEEWRSEVAVLTNNSLKVIEWVGGNEIFGHRTLLTGIGAPGPEAAVVVGDLIYGCDDRGAWLTDGASYKRLMNPQVHKFFQERLNQEALQKICVAYDSFNERVLFQYPSGTATANSEALAWSTKYENWQFFTWARGCADRGDALNMHLFGGVTGGIYQQTRVPLPPASSELVNLKLLKGTFELSLGYGRGSYGRGPYGGTVKGKP